jgi:hypothetical protein
MVGIGIHRAVLKSQGPEVDSWVQVAHFFRDRLFDPDEDDLELADAMSASSGSLFSVATYSAPFELRKVQLIWSQKDAAVASEDSRVTTFHLAKVSGGAVSSDWVAGDFTTLQTAFGSFWDTLKGSLPEELVYDRLKVYKAGPAVAPPQPPVFDADVNVPGANTPATPLPPQVAVSVTEIAGSKRYWGRFYLPAPGHDGVSPYGRLTAGLQSAWADAVDTLYTTLKTAGLEPVVYRQALPERETKAGATLPARAASAWTVEKIQVDDVYDVIRRRRFKYPLTRVQREI